MTPKEKAEQIVLRYKILIAYDSVLFIEWVNPNDPERNRRILKDAKKYALAAVDFIVEQNNVWILQTEKGTNNYWEEVKKEINKL